MKLCFIWRYLAIELITLKIYQHSSLQVLELNISIGSQNILIGSQKAIH